MKLCGEIKSIIFSRPDSNCLSIEQLVYRLTTIVIKVRKGKTLASALQDQHLARKYSMAMKPEVEQRGTLGRGGGLA
jgi:hypothetical protein